jgi:hypothetical protein
MRPGAGPLKGEAAVQADITATQGQVVGWPPGGDRACTPLQMGSTQTVPYVFETFIFIPVTFTSLTSHSKCIVFDSLLNHKHGSEGPGTKRAQLKTERRD